MKKLRGGRLTIALAVLAAMTIAACGVAFRDYFLERWYIARLDSPEPEMRNLAIRKLGEMRSVRALPHLRTLFLDRGKNGKRIAGPCMKALGSIGPPAIPIAEEALASPDVLVRASGIMLLIGMSREEAHRRAVVPILLRQLDSRDKYVRSLAGLSLRGLLVKSKVELSSADRQKLERVYPEGSTPTAILQEALEGIGGFLPRKAAGSAK
jgi:HEAT repeat protein